MATTLTEAGGALVGGTHTGGKPVGGGDAALIPGVRLPCPQCGALLTPPYQVETFTCPWCGSTLHPGEGLRVFHLVERLHLSRAEAAQALRRWFAGPETPRGLEEGAQVDVAELHSFPFLRVRGQGVERILPLAPLPSPDLLDLPFVPADMTAATGAEVGEGGSATVDDATGAVSVEIDPETLRDALRAASGDSAIGELVIEERAYYPVAYRFEGEWFTAVISASGGTVLTRRRPARSEVVGERALALGVLTLVFAEAAVLPGLALKVVAIGLTSAGLYPLIRWLVATRL